jgi:hypothetical protein
LILTLRDPDQLNEHEFRTPGGFYLKGVNNMYTILLIILVLMLIGALPTWPYSASWGYYPSGGLGLILIIVLVLVLAGRV